MTIATKPPRILPQRPPAITMPLAQAHLVGTVPGVGRCVEIHGERYKVGTTALEELGPIPPALPGEIRLTERETRLIEGTPNTRTRTFRAFPWTGPAYEELASKSQRRSAAVAAKRELRPVDMLARLPLLARQPERVISLGGGLAREPLPLSLGPVTDTEANSAMLRLGRKAKAIIEPPKPAPRGGAAIVATLEAKGYTLSITPSGRLLVQARGGGLTDPELETIREAHRLIVGALTGHPVLCEFEHSGKAPEAATIVAIDVAACDAHAAGDSTPNPTEAA